MARVVIAKPVLETVVLPVEFTRDRLHGIYTSRTLTKTQMAQTCGYERAAFHRNLKTGKPTLRMLYGISTSLGLSMDYWFPARAGGSRCSPEVADQHLLVNLGEEAPLTQQIMMLVRALDAVKKNTVFIALQDSVTVEIIALLGTLDSKQKAAVLSAVQKTYPKLDR